VTTPNFCSYFADISGLFDVCWHWLVQGTDVWVRARRT